MSAKVFALIDCNNFFASCERVFRPDLTDKPVAVLSNNDGCIIARSNEVKALGIPMGAPLFQVEKVLKGAKAAIFSANFALYGDISQRITSVIQRFAPAVEVYSIDESFVDITKLDIDDYQRWGQELRRAIWQETGMPVSIGISTSKTLAKAASEYAKKTACDVHVAIDVSVREDLLKWLPLGEVWGIGWRLTPKLKEFGISTAWDLSRVNDDWILKTATTRGLTTVKELRGESIIGFDEPEKAQKQIARTRAFGHTVRDYHQIETAVANFTAHAAAKLRKQNSVCLGVVTFVLARKGENLPFRSNATLVKLSEATCDTAALIKAAIEGLAKVYDKDLAYKKAGIVLVDIHPQAEWQLSLGSNEELRKQRLSLMEAVDGLNKRFGPATVWHASEDRLHSKWKSKQEHISPAYTTDWRSLPKLRA